MGDNRRIIPNFAEKTPMKPKQILISLVGLAAIASTAFAVWAQSDSATLKRPDGKGIDPSPKIALAYVVDRYEDLPDPDMFSHLIYAFGNFNDSLDGVVIRHPEKLKAMAALKERNPELKVILGLNDYRRPGFCEMTGDKKKRSNYVKSVKKTVEEYNLDGVDLDWEFPTTDKGGHTASPNDDKNYVKLVKDLRKALGKDKWISYYSNNSGQWIDHKGMLPYISYVNVSGYNLAIPRKDQTHPFLHQSPLYPSKKTGDWCVSKAVERHISKYGIPKEKILVGIPFFGRGMPPFKSETDCCDFDKYSDGLQIVWDEQAQAPYYADEEGNLILGYDDERSIAAKFDFIRANGLQGIFVWSYEGDYADKRLSKAIESLRQKTKD